MIDILTTETREIIIKVTYELVKFKQNTFPYFSITANTQYSGGCLHDEIEKYFPGKYTDLIKLHLSDINGIPMYAFENGWYFYQKADTITLSEYLRISENDARELLEKNISKEEFFNFVEQNKPRWKQEADYCIKKHNLEITEK